jgi:hypothetical protein
VAPAGPATASADGGKTATPAQSPSQDPGFQRVVRSVHSAAAKQRAHAPARAKAAEAQAAAVSPPSEVASRAKDRHVQEMDRTQPRPFNRAAFKAALLAKIKETAPKSLEEADNFKESGKVADVKTQLQGTVQEGKKNAAGPVAETAAKAPDPSGIAPKPVTPLPPVEPGAPPGDVGVTAATPKPRSDTDISLKAGPQQIEQQMADADVTDDQLKKSNEPVFQSTVAAKESAKQQSDAAPVAFRAEEKTELAAARGDAASIAHRELGAMHGARGKTLHAAFGHQTAAKAKDEQRRAEVAGHIQGIYDKTKSAVETKLRKLDEDVARAFDRGAAAAQKVFEDYVAIHMAAYKADRYSGALGGLRWGKDKLFGLPDEVNEFYVAGRDLYVAHMDRVLDEVTAIVDVGLTGAKGEIAKARQEIATYVGGLEPALRDVGKHAAQEIGGKLDQLEQSVDDKQNELIDSLAHKYNERIQQIDGRIAAMKAENRGLIAAIKDAVVGVIQTIIKLKNMLLSALARAASAIGMIIRDPIGFLGNLVGAVKLGVQNFASRIEEHLKQGFMEWLFGAVAEAGIQLPKSFDLKGILGLVLQVLGLTWTNFRARAVALLGEKVVGAIEKASDIFMKVVTEGPGALWEWIKDKLGDIKTMVIDQLRDFVITRVITAGITWLIGLLNPASAFIKACKAIYDIIMFFVERASQIAALVNAIIDSVVAIASGSIGSAAAKVETALARAIPVVIGLLASLLGVSGITAKIKSVIEAIRKPVAAAIDWVIGHAVTLVKAAGKAIGGLFGGKEKKETKDTTKNTDPEKAAKLTAGKAALREAEAAHTKDGAVSKADAKFIASDVQRKHPVFKSINVVDGKDSWNFQYFASASEEIEGAQKAVFENPEQIYRMIYDIGKARMEKSRQKTEGGISIKPGEHASVLGSQIKHREKVPGFRQTVALDVGGIEPVYAQQGKGSANIIIRGLGNYDEIAAKLLKLGYTSPELAQAVLKLQQTGQVDNTRKGREAQRMLALLFGAETARRDIATAQSPLALLLLQQGTAIEQVFNRQDPLYPPAIKDFAEIDRNTEAVVIAGASMGTGTQKSANIQANIKRNADLVFKAVMHLQFSNTGELEKRVIGVYERMELPRMMSG